MQFSSYLYRISIKSYHTLLFMNQLPLYVSWKHVNQFVVIIIVHPELDKQIGLWQRCDQSTVTVPIQFRLFSFSFILSLKTILTPSDPTIPGLMSTYLKNDFCTMRYWRRRLVLDGYIASAADTLSYWSMCQDWQRWMGTFLDSSPLFWILVGKVGPFALETRFVPMELNQFLLYIMKQRHL